MRGRAENKTADQQPGDKQAPVDQRAEDLDSARLITRAQAGDRKAFAAVYTRYFERVYKYMRLVLRDTPDAEDATQQVFLRALEALPRYEHRKPFRAWLFTIARNYAISQVRKEQEVPLDPSEIDSHIERQSGAEAGFDTFDWITDPELLLFIEKLPLLQRQVLVLRYMLDLSHAEIARILGRTPATVRAHLHRAQLTLGERLISVGKGPKAPVKGPESQDQANMKSWTKRDQVIRERRFALH